MDGFFWGAIAILVVSNLASLFCGLCIGGLNSIAKESDELNERLN